MSFFAFSVERYRNRYLYTMFSSILFSNPVRLNFALTVLRFVWKLTLLIELFTLISTKHFTSRADENFAFILEIILNDGVKNLFDSSYIKPIRFLRDKLRFWDMSLCSVMKKVIGLHLSDCFINTLLISKIPRNYVYVGVLFLKFINFILVWWIPAYQCVNVDIFILNQVLSLIETKLTSGSRYHHFFLLLHFESVVNLKLIILIK